MAKTFKDYLQEAVVASKYHCKDCNDKMHKPTTDCPHDSHDEKGSHWIDNNGNGIHDLDESGLQRYTGIKKYGKKGFEELQKAGREGASEEQKGAIKDKHLKKKK